MNIDRNFSPALHDHLLGVIQDWMGAHSEDDPLKVVNTLLGIVSSWYAARTHEEKWLADKLDILMKEKKS